MSAPATHPDSSTAPGVEVVKWYTRARKFPQLVGRTSDGTKLPGGPYTYTQVGLGVGVLLVGQKTSRLWAHFGTVTNVFVLLLVCAVTVFVAGRLPIGGRNPLSLASGAVQAFTAPRQGKHQGFPVRIARPRRTGAGQLLVILPLAVVDHAEGVSTGDTTTFDFTTGDSTAAAPVVRDTAARDRGAPQVTARGDGVPVVGSGAGVRRPAVGSTRAVASSSQGGPRPMAGAETRMRSGDQHAVAVGSAPLTGVQRLLAQSSGQVEERAQR